MNNRLYAPLALWAALVAMAIFLVRGSSLNHDLTQFMPAGASQQQQLAVDLLRRGPATRLILLALEGGSLDQRARVSRSLVDQLSATSFFLQVANGQPSLANDGMRRLFRYRYLLDPRTSKAEFSTEGLRQSLQQRLDELSRALPTPYQDQLAADPTRSFPRLLERWLPANDLPRQYGVWVSPDHQRALLVAITSASGFDPDAQERTLAAIRAAFARSTPPSDMQLKLSGTPVFAVSARTSIRDQVTLLSTAAGVLVALYLLLAYRSPALALVAAVPLLTGLLAGAAAVALIFDSIHGITLVFGLTLLGVAIDYPIHLFSHLGSSANGHDAIRRIRPTLRLGVITTCIAYFSIARTDFTGLAQLGIFTTTGLIAAAAVTHWLLPHLVPGNTRPSHGRLFQHLSHAMLNIPRRVSAGALGLTLLALPILFFTAPPQWETELSALSPVAAQARALAEELHEQLDTPEAGHLISIQANEPQVLLRKSEKLDTLLTDAVAHGLIEDFNLPTHYLPSSATQLQRQQTLPESRSLEMQLEQALADMPFRKSAFNPFIESIEASRSLPPLSLEAALTTPLAARISPLLLENRDSWHALVTLNGLRSQEAFSQWWAAHRLPDSHYLDLKQSSSGLLNDFRDSALERFGLGVAVIILIIGVGLQSLRAGFMVLIPVFLATLLNAAILGLLDIKLSLFHLIAMLLSIGIGIDYNLFFQRREQQPSDRLETLHAILICALSTFTVFALLASSDIPVLHAIGLTVSIGVVLSFSLALLSSRLALPDSECAKSLSS